MFDVEYAKEIDIPFDGGFSYEYLSNGSVRITNIVDENGNPCQVSKKLFKQFCDYARDCLKSWQEMADGRMFEAVNNL